MLIINKIDNLVGSIMRWTSNLTTGPTAAWIKVVGDY